MKRSIQMAILFLLLGAIVNVAVAWGSAVLIGFEDVVDSARGFRTSRSGVENVEVYRRPTTQRVSGLKSRTPCAVHSEGPDPLELWPYWIGFPEELATDKALLMWDVEARGAPCLALWSTTMELHESPDGIRHRVKPSGSVALPLPDFSGGMGTIPRVLPLRPIWPGFAINTIFYAAVLWTIFALPSKSRRYFRGKRGLCPACAYPIGTNAVCTECGGAIRSLPSKG